MRELTWHTFERHPYPVTIYATIGAAPFHAVCRAHRKVYSFHKYPAACMSVEPGVLVVAMARSVQAIVEWLYKIVVDGAVN